MKDLERGSNKKLTIVNFEKLKGCIHPPITTINSFTFQLKVTDVSDSEDHYMVYVEYGVEVLSNTYARISRELSTSPKGFEGYRIDVQLPYYNVHTHFVLSHFDTPLKFLKELTSYIKTENETLPF
jgi:hypothetical protein